MTDEESDLNFDEIDKMVGNIDDLDDDLFNDSTNKLTKNVTDAKKKVVFQEDDEKYSSGKTKKIENLFGIKSLDSIESTDKLYKEPTSSTETMNLNASNRDKKSLFDDTDDVMRNLTENTKSVDSVRARKSFLIEDMFGSNKRPLSSKSLIDDSLTKSTSNLFPVKSMGELSRIEETSTPKKDNDYTPTIGPLRETRRGRRTQSSVVPDPLGLLSIPDEATVSTETLRRDSIENIKEPTKSKAEEDLPGWLGGGTSKVKTRKIEEELEKEHSNFYSEHLGALMKTQFEQQAAIVVMQQQEHEFKTAANLSQQNDQLNCLLNSQKSKLNAQEAQFNMLIQKQMERQSLLETQMKSQQDRINQYIDILMAQPTSIPITNSCPINTKINDRSDGNLDNESLVKKLQIENLYLETSLQSLKDNHEREMNLNVESYNKQISFLKDAIEKLEKRLRQENENLEADYEAKIEKLKNEKTQMEDLHKEEIEDTKNKHLQSIEEICQRHSNNTILIEKEYEGIIKNLSQAKEVENSALGIIMTNKGNLESMLDKSEVIIKSMETTCEIINKKDNANEREKEEHLKTWEQDLGIKKRDLEKRNDALEIERTKLIETLQQLDLRMAQMNSSFDKKSKKFEEMEEIFQSKEQRLLKERELFEEKIHWERDLIQSMKESWLMEQERQLKSLMEEKNAIATERAKMEVVNRLKTNENDMMNAELEAIIKTAQEATISANQERKKWKERIQDLQIQRENIEDKERQLLVRAKDLEKLTQSALLKKEEGGRALKEARRMEEQHKETLSKLQTQLEGLTQRENKIAAEKFILARERIALRTSQVEKPEKDIEIHIGNNSSSFLNEMRSSSQISTHFKDIVDPHLLMLKLTLDDDPNKKIPLP